MQAAADQESSELSRCRNCGAPREPEEERCAYCGVYQGYQSTRPWNYVLQSRTARVRAIYPALILIGVVIALFIYGFAFDSLSETALVRLTPLWFFSITFGGFGYLAEKLLPQVTSGQAKTLAEAYRGWREAFFDEHPLAGLLLGLLLFPFSYFYFRTRSSLLIAFAGSAVWGVLLLVFFNGIFPAL